MNPLLYSLPLQAAPEVIDRIPSGYSNFVIPFVVGISFMLIWLTVGLIRLLAKIPADDRRRFWKSLITPKIALKNIKDLFCDCLFHTKIWKRKPLLGYMHSSIAFGWFMLIVLGHIEVALFVPKHLAWTDGGLFYPIFYRFFVWINPGHVTLRGWFFFFLMDFSCSTFSPESEWPYSKGSDPSCWECATPRSRRWPTVWLSTAFG